jgi:amino acid permease
MPIGSLSEHRDSSLIVLDRSTHEILLPEEFDPYSTESCADGRNIFQRLFSKMEKDSLRGGAISMITSALGVAIFSYPKSFSYYGYVLGPLAILYSAFSTSVSYVIIAELCAMYPNHTLYSQLVKHYLGGFWSQYTSWVLMIYYLGCNVGFTIVINICFREVFGMKIALYYETNYDEYFKKNLSLLVTIMLTLVYFMGTLLRRAGIIHYAGLLVVLMGFYLTAVTIFQAKEYAEEFKPEYQPYGCGKLSQYLLQFGVFFFAFDSVQGFHQVYSNIRMPTTRRIRKLGYLVSFSLFLLYISFTSAAYYSLGTSMQSEEFDIFPNKKPLSNDPNNTYMLILKATLIVSLLASYTVNAIPLKTQILAHFQMKDSGKNHFFMAIVISFLTGILAYAYPEVQEWMSMMGALGANSLAVMIPTVCFYYAVKDKPEFSTYLKLAGLWASVTTFICMICIGMLLLDFTGYHPTW